MIDVAESTAERHLRLRRQSEARKDQHAIVFQRFEHGFGQRIVGGQPVGIQPDDLGSDRRGEIVD